MKLLLSISISLLIFISLEADSSESALTLSEIYDLKNPYEKKTSSDANLIEGSEQYIRLNARKDQFDQCQGHGMITYIALANHIDVMAKSGFPESRTESMKYMSRQIGLEYPFDSEEIAGSTMKRIEKLAIETGVEHPGSSDQHLESIASIFWDKCLKLPISFFEEDWKSSDEVVYDEDGYDEDGYDEQGNTREDNED